MTVGYSNYVNYVNSFYCNDVNMLKKRQKQSNIVSKTAAVTGTALAGWALVGKKALPGILSVVCLLGAFNSHNYSKQTQEKINQLEANA